MKKVLLLSAAVCMAISMSAQKLSNEKATLSLDKNLAVPTFTKTYAQSVITKTVAPKKAAKKVQMPKLDSLTGLYVCDNTNAGDGTKTFTQTHAIEIEHLTAPQVLEPLFEDAPEYSCNVIVRNLITAGSEVLAIYDEADGTLSIPFQFALAGNYEYYFVNCTQIDEEDQVYMDYNKPFVLTLKQDANGWYFLNETTDVGFALVVFNEEGNPIGFGGTCFNEVMVTPCNYICNSESRHSLQKDATWEDVEPYGVFIEQIDEITIAIHNFMELGTVYVEMDEEGKLGHIETLQPLLYERINEAGDYDYIGPIMWTFGADDTVNADYTVPYLEGGFYTLTYENEENPEDTYEERGFALVTEEEHFWEYYSLGRDGIEGGYAPLTTHTFFVEIDKPALNPEGLTNATLTPTSMDLFNLVGQRVNRTAKGIVIENGKKVIK